MNNKWAVSYINFFDNDLQMATTFADSKIEALFNAAYIFGIDVGDFVSCDPDEFKDFCFDCDCAIEAYKI